MRALRKKKSVKAIVITGVSLLLVAAIVVGVLWYLGHRSDPVKVAPVSMFMGWLSNESTQSGTVTADNLQKVYLSLIHISEPTDVEESRMPSSA